LDVLFGFGYKSVVVGALHSWYWSPPGLGFTGLVWVLVPLYIAVELHSLGLGRFVFLVQRVFFLVVLLFLAHSVLVLVFVLLLLLVPQLLILDLGFMDSFWVLISLSLDLDLHFIVMNLLFLLPVGLVVLEPLGLGLGLGTVLATPRSLNLGLEVCSLVSVSNPEPWSWS